MGDLCEEGGELAFAGGKVAGAGEFGEGPGGPDEGRVGVEPLGRAGRVVLVQEQRVVELLAHERLHGGAALSAGAVPPRLRAGSDQGSNHRGGEQ